MEQETQRVEAAPAAACESPALSDNKAARKAKYMGIFCMIGSALSVSMMQICAAMTSGKVPLFEQMLFRNVSTAVIAYIILRKKGIRQMFGHRENRGTLVLRCVFGLLAMYCLFYAVANGNQGEVAILSKLSPCITIMLAAIFLKERVFGYQMAAMVLALAGAFLAANPTFSGVSLAALGALACSLFSGVSYFCINRLRGKEDGTVTVFVFGVFMTCISGTMTLIQFQPLTSHDFLCLIGVGFFAAIGQVLLALSYTHAAASEVGVFNYAGIPASMVLGYLILGEPVKMMTLFGSVLVVLSGIINFAGDGTGRHKIKKG